MKHTENIANELFNNVKHSLNNLDTTTIESAIDYIKKNNKIDYSIEITVILINEMAARTDTIVASLIYNVFGKDIELNEIDTSFNSEVKDIIAGLKKIPNLDLNKFSKHPENFIKLLLTITTDVRAILIILARQLYKMRSLKNKDSVCQIETSSETFYLFAPIAHRLGLYNIKTELEESSMKYMYNDIYKSIAKKLTETKAARDKYISTFINPLKGKLKKNGIVCTIKGRPKSIYSIWRKMKTQNVNFEEVYDLFAIRIIIKGKFENEKNNCWKVYSIVTDLYQPNPHRLRDWISSPKLSGYESLHTTVIDKDGKWVEVQIRTERMDEIAEKGHAAHWKYKEKNTNISNKTDWLAKMREALENPDTEPNMLNSKNKAALYSDEVFIFTPNGDLKNLTYGYSVLDFAFSIHSNIGERCTGAIVNDKIVPIKHILKNGDTVKILTSKTQYPKYEWLEIAKSSKAKSKIRKAVKSKSYKDSDLGKEMIKQKTNQLKKEFADDTIANLTKHFNFKHPVELYQAVGSGKLDIGKVKKVIIQLDSKEKNKPEKHNYNSIVEKIEEVKKRDFLIIDKHVESINYQFANCCNPIFGDKIFGFVTVSRGTKIHKNTCPNAKDLKIRHPYRIVESVWNKESEFALFPANIKIVGNDNMGMLNKITEIITNELKLNLKAFNLKSNNNTTFEGIMVVYVSGTNQLSKVIKSLKNIKNITSVKRVNA